MNRAALVLCLLAACKSKRRPDDPMPEPEIVAPKVVDIDAAKPWPELADYPSVAASRVVALPSRPDVPRFDLGGPVISGDIAVVSSSQIGFCGIDWKKGTIAWTKPAAHHVAPPIVIETGFALIGECVNPPTVPDGETLLGCLRAVTVTGSDLAYIGIRGKTKAVEEFAAEPGEQRVWRERDRLVWKRGERAVTIDPINGIARPVDATSPPLHVAYKDRAWDISQQDGKIVARGSLLGIGVLAHAVSPVGDAALVMRVDATMRRDLVAGYAANARLAWVYPLPEIARQDPVGVAIAEGATAVVVFHDGDTVTILPELSAAPTTPAGASASSKKPTP